MGGQRPSFQNGLECAQAKSQETQRHQRVRKMLQLKKRLKKTTKKKKKRRRRKKKRRRNKKFLSPLLRASNSYRCNYESFHSGHCFYTKLDDCFMSSLCCHYHTTIHAIRPFIQVLQVNLVRFNVDE